MAGRVTVGNPPSRQQRHIARGDGGSRDRRSRGTHFLPLGFVRDWHCFGVPCRKVSNPPTNQPTTRKKGQPLHPSPSLFISATEKKALNYPTWPWQRRVTKIVGKHPSLHVDLELAFHVSQVRPYVPTKVLEKVSLTRSTIQ